jgi:hypothetical protein
LDARDPGHRRWCFQCITIAALCIWVKFWMLFSINHWKLSVQIPTAKQYCPAVMRTEEMWSESLLIHLILKVVFVFAEKSISDRYVGSVVIFYKAFNIRRSIHDGNSCGQQYITRSRDHEIPNTGWERWVPNPSILNRYLVLRFPTVIGMYRCPQGFLSWTYLRILRIFTWRDELCTIYFSVL